MTLAAPYSILFTFGTPGTDPSLGEFSSPRSVAVNPVDGDVAIADFANNCISIWSS